MFNPCVAQVLRLRGGAGQGKKPRVSFRDMCSKSSDPDGVKQCFDIAAFDTDNLLSTLPKAMNYNLISKPY